MVKIIFSEEEKEKYLNNIEESEWEIYDEDGKIMNDVILCGKVIKKSNIGDTTENAINNIESTVDNTKDNSVDITENVINNTENAVDNIENIVNNEEKREKGKRKRNNDEEIRKVEKKNQDEWGKRDKKIEKLIEEMNATENESGKEIVERMEEETMDIVELAKQFY